MNKLLASMSLIIIANIIVWFQFQGHFWSNKLIWKSPYFIMLAGAIISPMFWYATKFSYEHFGQYLTVRPIGFGVATLTFGLLTAIFLKELPSFKIWISLILAVVIILLNISNTMDKVN